MSCAMMYSTGPDGGGGKGPPNDRGEFFAVRCTLLMYCTVGSNMAQNAARAAVESH